MGSPHGPATAATIELTVPANPDLLYLIRFHVGAAAAHADMRLEAVEDLQLAVDELCLSVLSQVTADYPQLKVSVTWEESMVEVVCTVNTDVISMNGSTNGKVHRADIRPALPADLSARVLDALVDEHGTFSEPGCRGAWLRKRQVMSGQRG